MRYIVDEGGEFVGELRDGDRILRKESVEKLEGQEPWSFRSFAVMNTDEMQKVVAELDRNEKAVFCVLIPYVQYATCLLAYSNGRCITSGDMAELTGFSRHTAEAALCGLVKKNILCKVRNSKEVQWYINPYLVCKGRVINKTLKTMFRNYVRRCK